jgi:hypothetical protein
VRQGDEGPRAPRSARSRVVWFIGLYVVSAVLFAAVVYGLRAVVPR